MKAITIALGLALAAGSAMAQDLRPVSEFEGIENEADRSVALFEEMTKVIQHPRCLNCHPVSENPRQGDDMELHHPIVIRGGQAGMGIVGMECSTCHSASNVSFTGAEGSIPGHEPWHLAPASMGWIGLTPGEICAQLKDPARNGDRTLADIHDHNANDGLVGWAWDPGEGRTPAPGSQAEFGELTQAWIDTGAVCPS